VTSFFVFLSDVGGYYGGVLALSQLVIFLFGGDYMTAAAIETIYPIMKSTQDFSKEDYLKPVEGLEVVDIENTENDQNIEPAADELKVRIRKSVKTTPRDRRRVTKVLTPPLMQQQPSPKSE
jgi:hypothetical protein